MVLRMTRLSSFGRDSDRPPSREPKPRKEPKGWKEPKAALEPSVPVAPEVVVVARLHRWPLQRYVALRFLQMTALEEMGRSLFFSPLTNCASCHMLNISSLQEGETFSNYRNHNIGLPAGIVL